MYTIPTRTKKKTTHRRTRIAGPRIRHIEHTSRHFARVSGTIGDHAFSVWLTRNPDDEFCREMTPGSRITSLLLSREEDHAIVAEFGCGERSITARWCKRPTNRVAQRLVAALAATLARRVFKGRR